MTIQTSHTIDYLSKKGVPFIYDETSDKIIVHVIKSGKFYRAGSALFGYKIISTQFALVLI